jgi:vacuolar-type H+-ATPase subunit I/STV1
MKKLLCMYLLLSSLATAGALHASNGDNLLALPIYAGIAMVEVTKDAITSTGRAVKDAVIEAGAEIKEESKEVAAQFTDFYTEQTARMKALAHTTHTAIAQKAQSMADSEIGQDVAEIATQLAQFPAQASQDIKEAAQNVADFANITTQALADSKIVAHAYDAKEAVAHTAQRAIATAQKAAQASLKSEAAQDLEEVLTQFADFPKEAYERLSQAVAHANNKISTWRDTLKK